MKRGGTRKRALYATHGERASGAHVAVLGVEGLEAVLVSARARLHSRWLLWVDRAGYVRLTLIRHAEHVVYPEYPSELFEESFLLAFAERVDGVVVGSPLSRYESTCGRELLTEREAESRHRWLERVLATLRTAWWSFRRGGAG